VQVVLPKLDEAIWFAQLCQQSFPAALLRVLFDGLDHGLGRELLVVAHDVLEFEARCCACDQVYMVAHDAPREKFQALGLLAVPKALHKDVLLSRSREDIHPAHGGIGEIVQILMVVDLPAGRQVL
jgi:hypothetical protein